MKRASRDTTITVSSETREKLKNVKSDLGLKNMDALMQYLLSLSRGSLLQVADESAGEGERSEPQKKRKINVQPPLYTMDILAERPEMLEYYTGFSRGHIDLLVKRLDEVGKLVSSFCVLLSSCSRWFFWADSEQA